MAKRRERAANPKKVVYLLGAGATQAEVSYLGAGNTNLLMSDDDDLGQGVATRILRKLAKRWQGSFSTEEGTDIEKLISLLAASTVASHHRLAEQMRKLYFEELCQSLDAAKILTRPTLAVGLLELHQMAGFASHEALSGVITTNHDGLLQVAAQEVHGSVNIGVPFQSTDLTPSAALESPPILQLHGSFTWSFGLPLAVGRLHAGSAYSGDTVWIPPTILKEPKSYPFNKLAGTAYEMLSKHCDVLRVVGSSLAQNDWNVLSMVFNAQRHRELMKQRPFRVELIMPPSACEAVLKNCSYLKSLFPIGQLTDGDLSGYKDPGAITSEMKNTFAYWLKEKIHFHRRRGNLGTAPLRPAMAQIVGDIP